MGLSLWRASAEALQLILNTDCQKKMKESLGETMRSRKQEKKAWSRGMASAFCTCETLEYNICQSGSPSEPFICTLQN